MDRKLIFPIKWQVYSSEQKKELVSNNLDIICKEIMRA